MEKRDKLQIGPMGSHATSESLPEPIQVPSRIPPERTEESFRNGSVSDWFVREPDSWKIAKRLTDARMMTCEHGRNPCIMRCGVECVDVVHGTTGTRVWVPIPLWRREKWLRHKWLRHQQEKE